MAATFVVLALRPVWTDISFWMIIGAIIASGHLMLDSLTEAGVYLARRRVAVAHFSYDNQFLNAGFIVAGMCLAVMSLHV